MIPSYVKFKAFRENYDNIKLTKEQMERNANNPKVKIQQGKMTVEEQLWAEKFEELLYAEQRGKVHDAIDAFTALTSRSPNDTEKANININIQTAISSNPGRAAAKAKSNKKRGHSKGIQKPRSTMYDSADYVRVAPGKILKDDLGFTAVYSTAEAIESASGSNDHTDDHLADKVYKPFKVEAGLNPDETAVMLNPEDGMIEAIDHAAKKNRSLEKLVMDAKLSKEATELLKAKMQTMTYAASTYSKHANLILDMNFVLKAPNGQLWVIDQHDRLQTLALYLKRRTSESIVTHAEVSYPGLLLQNWVFKRGARSDIEGKAVQYEGV